MKRKVLVYKIQVEIDPATINVEAMLAALEPFGRVTVTDYATRRVEE